MIILKSKFETKKIISAFKNQQHSIGFIPTMGALHKGHISLINKAKSECSIVIASIFVNPTQFNNLNDLKNYPRTFEADCIMLEKAGCNVIFAPEIAEMYSEKELELKNLKIEDKAWTEGKLVDFGTLEIVMEGAHRPGHFNGVAQIVSKLFRIIEPDKTYFGQKDFQQLAIIRSMVEQLSMPIEIIDCPILREPNGLAMSSRNERLTTEQRKTAALISKTLFQVKNFYTSKSIAELKKFAEQQLNAEPQFKLEYFEIADVNTLKPASEYKANQKLIACVALQLGEIRLIDNILL